MAILGSIIKGIIDISDKVIPESNPLEEQEEVLKSLLEKAKDTQFGKHYDFEAILESENPATLFAEKLPYFDYNSINEAWWSKLHDGETDVTWPGTPHYFALSSGTTGKSSKRIPVTDEMVDVITQRVIERLSERAIRDIAWEVVPQMADLIIKRIAEEKMRD